MKYNIDHMTMNFDQFKKFYDKNGFCYNQLNPPKNTLNEKQLKSAYNRYLKGVRKKEKRKHESLIKTIEKEQEKIENLDYSIDSELESVYSQVDSRDRGKCRLISILNIEDLYVLKSYSWEGLINTIDHAHIFPKSVFPKLKYEKNNIVLLNRYSHSLIDQYKNPITGDQISKENQIKWWIKIAGIQQWGELIKLKENLYGKI